ncbi:YbaB/EbfC family nucleoid-associated protein [Nocardia yunnanensis]|uniref:YbaB/EbfC family nucleoid-associated protein n=1 Tax=Nocardia yunnanensis TaxID=2382165 RepID=UPI0013C46B32|nr:YbaB/EbfC family nucleoid-associated protein [Nocardia yunnanensis]
MEQWERDEIRSANDSLKSALASVQAEFDRELAEIGEIHAKLAALKVHATTPSGLARITVNASGMVTEISIADDAFRRCTPKQLTAELNTTIRGGVEAAAQARAQVTQPVRAIVDGMADLSDIVPGAPNLKELREQFAPTTLPPVDGPAGKGDR